METVKTVVAASDRQKCSDCYHITQLQHWYPITSGVGRRKKLLEDGLKFTTEHLEAVPEHESRKGATAEWFSRRLEMFR